MKRRAQIVCIIIYSVGFIPFEAAALISSPTDEDRPSIAEVHQTALRYAGLESDDPHRWKRRARVAKLLPRIQFDFAHKTSHDIDVNISDSVYVGSNDVNIGPEEGRYAQSIGSGDNVGVRAIWSFDELMFSDDELRVSAELRDLMRDRNALLEAVNRAYFTWERLKGERALLAQGKNTASAAQGASRAQLIFLKEIDIKQAQASLDAMTGGWFSRRLGEGG